METGDHLKQQMRDGQATQSELTASQGLSSPVFGAGRGTLTIVQDDDDHLEDFKELME